MRKTIGKYSSYMFSFRLYFDSDLPGGYFELGGEKDNITTIVVGNVGTWEETVVVLHHEIIEAVLSFKGLRYQVTPNISDDNGLYSFMMTHTEFSEALALASIMIDGCTDDLKKAWKKFNK